MRILFIGDYSNLHAMLARQIRAMGNYVDILSDRCGYMNTQTDIFLERKKGLFGGVKYLYDIFQLLHQLKDYDVVQLINPNFFSLRPGKIKYFFEQLKNQNRSMFLTLAGDDYFFVKACYDAKLFRFSEFKIGDKPSPHLQENPNHMYGWMSAANKQWNQYLYDKIDGAMSVLPEYDMAARPILGEKLKFTNLPMEVDEIVPTHLEIDGPLKLFIGIRGGYELQKGTKYMLSVAKDLEREMEGQMEVECVRNLPLSEYLDKMKSAHIVLDQFYSYSPAMNALYAMAMGKVVGSGAQPEYYEYIGNPEKRPIINLSPLEPDLKETLRSFVENPSLLPEMGIESRKLVETHNDARIVAARFVNHWNDILGEGAK